MYCKCKNLMWFFASHRKKAGRSFSHLISEMRNENPGL